MKKNQYDLATDFLKERMNLGFAEMHKQYGKSNPYRQEPVDPKQRLYDYMQKTPQDFEFARQNFPPEIVDKYIADMEGLKARYMK